MATEFGDFEKIMASAETEYKSFHAKAKSTIAEIKKYQGSVKSLPSGAPNVKKRGWLKKAEKAKAGPKVTAALKKVESSGTRASCLEAVKVIKAEKGNKEVEAIGVEIDKLLKLDEKTAKELSKHHAAIKTLKGQASKLKGPGDKIDAKAKSAAKEIATLVKEIKADNAAKGG